MSDSNPSPASANPKTRFGLTRILNHENPRWVLLGVVLEKIKADDIKLRAASLSYSSLASLVPLIAIILAILSGPAFESRREEYLNQLSNNLIPTDTAFLDPDDPEVADRFKQQEEFKDTFRVKIKEFANAISAVSVFGFLLLLATVWFLFQAVENSFNAIWRADRRRPFFHRVATATSMLFWGPVTLAISVSLAEYLKGWPFLGTYLIPAFFSTFAFTAFYMLMPNAKVNARFAMISGACAAAVWELAKLLFVLYVTGVVSYYRVYGSLGLVPMLFLWVFINWLIILYGAELAFVLQHRKAMVDEWRTKQREKLHSEQLLAASPVAPALVLAAAIEVARRFKEKCPGGVRVSQLAQSLNVDHSDAQNAAIQLVSAGVLARVAPNDDSTVQDDPAYLPSCEPKACVVSALLAVAFNGKTMLGHGPSIDCARQLLAAASLGGGQRFTALTLADLADENRLLEHTSAQS